MNDEPEIEVEIVEDYNGLDLDNLGDIESVQFERETGIHVITITYDDDDPSAPKLHLGGTSMWLACSILAAASETLNMLRPPLTVTHEGEILFTQDYDDGD